MPISVVKTWEYVVNGTYSGGSLTARNQALWLALKEALTDTGSAQFVDAANSNISASSPWDVVASSDGSSAGASDNWSATSDIVGNAAGSAHSWIHLRQTDYFGSGDHLHLLLAVEDVADCSLGRVSYTRGSTGYNNDGTTTDRPTHAESTDEIVVRDGLTAAGDKITSDTMWGSDSSNTQAVLHVRMADDGSAGGWFLCIGGVCVSVAGWQDEEEGEPTEVHPFHVWHLGSDNNSLVTLDWTGVINGEDFVRSLNSAGVEVNGYVSQPVFASTETRMADNNASNSRALFPAHLAYVGSTSCRGELIDIWWGSTANNTGDQSPATPPVTRAQFDEMVIPWPSGASQNVA